MNTKKLLGTIIGVILFAALIAGATFAWLTFGVTVGNNVLTANTLNFVVKFEKGSAVTNLPVLDSNNINAKDAAVVPIVLKKNPTSPEGHASIWLQTLSETALTKAGVVRYVICRDEDVEEGTQEDDVCGNKVIMENDAANYANVPGLYNAGSVTNNGPIPLLSDARLADSASNGSAVVANCTTTSGLSMCTGSSQNTHKLLENGVSYFVYMWLEAEPLLNEHLDEQYYKKDTTEQYQIGKGGTPDYESGIKFDLYSGYVFSSATQLQD